jgi:hypothetical protein
MRIWLVTLAMAATSVDAAAKPFLCDTIRPGDTASAVARRVTGRADSRHEPWFHIIDRVRSRVIPKTAYDRILTGWQVCVPTARFALQPSGSGPIGTMGRNDPTTPFRASQPIAPARPIAGESAPRVNGLELALVVLGPALFGAVIGFGWQRMERVLTNRRSLNRDVRYFGDLFVKDFERPLVIEGVITCPIRARLRWVSFQRRLDIMLAPAPGRRYPNLDDHKRNVEYDVDRIADRLRHHPFVRQPLRAEGQWVVVPFQLKPRPRTGDRI